MLSIFCSYLSNALTNSLFSRYAVGIKVINSAIVISPCITRERIAMNVLVLTTLQYLLFSYIARNCLFSDLVIVPLANSISVHCFMFSAPCSLSPPKVANSTDFASLVNHLRPRQPLAPNFLVRNAVKAMDSAPSPQ